MYILYTYMLVYSKTFVFLIYRTTKEFRIKLLKVYKPTQIKYADKIFEI